MNKKTVAIAAGAFYLGSLGLPQYFSNTYKGSKLKTVPGKVAISATSTALLAVTTPIFYVALAFDKNDRIPTALENLIKKMKGDD
jgi:hypothetical protein